MYMQLINLIGIEINWSKKDGDNLIQRIRSILNKNNLDKNQFLYYQLSNYTYTTSKIKEDKENRTTPRYL